MALNSTQNEKARFDARLPREQKLFLEKAAFLGGFRNLTEFVFSSAQEKAKEIIKEKERIIASEKDAEIFFNAITNNNNANNNLKLAGENYKKVLKKKS